MAYRAALLYLMTVSPCLTVPNECYPTLLYLMTVLSCLTVSNDSVTLPFPHYCHLSCYRSLMLLSLVSLSLWQATKTVRACAHTHTHTRKKERNLERKNRTERTTASENVTHMHSFNTTSVSLVFLPAPPTLVVSNLGLYASQPVRLYQGERPFTPLMSACWQMYPKHRVALVFLSAPNDKKPNSRRPPPPPPHFIHSFQVKSGPSHGINGKCVRAAS